MPKIISSDDLAENSDIIFPVGVIMTKDKAPEISVYKELLEAGEYLERLSFDELFTEKAKAELIKMIGPFLLSRGYEIEAVVSKELIVTSRDSLNKGLILPSTEALMPDNSYENLTDNEPDPLGLGYLCFGTVIDGRIVSAASENPHDEDDKFIDIGVETAEGYENNGYAASNVVSLAYYLLDSGISVTYIAEEDNKPSIAVAKKAGFTENRTELRIIGRKTE